MKGALCIYQCYARKGWGPRAYVGHLTSIAFPTLGNLTKNLGPRVGWACSLFCVEEWDQVTSSHVNKNLPKAEAPTEILLEAHKKWKGIAENSGLAIAKEALLPPEDRLWLKDLEDVECNCERGQRRQQPNAENVKPI